MGSMISLSVGCIDIDWGKNEFFNSHLDLFQAGDEGGNDYNYVGKDEKPIIEVKESLVRKLSRVKPRLEMLGYTYESLDRLLRLWLNEEDAEAPLPSLSAFFEALKSLDWHCRGAEYVDFEDAIRVAYARQLRLNGQCVRDDHLIAFERMLDPYFVLRALAEFDEYSDLLVCWNFADVKEGGYVDDASFKTCPPASRWLVVTEGSTDAFVLQRALKKTQPDVADFFDFIDMSNGNPFPGVGNIVSFCKGLCRIGYGGRMLIVLDNDAAGNKAKQELCELPLPKSMMVTCLPVLDELKAFKTLGPSGENIEDINGRASAIECFLDFSAFDKQPVVRWTTYIPQMKQYQGELVSKEDYFSDFKKRSLTDDDYDWTKLDFLWRYLVGCCVKEADLSGKVKRLLVEVQPT